MQTQSSIKPPSEQSGAALPTMERNFRLDTTQPRALDASFRRDPAWNTVYIGFSIMDWTLRVPLLGVLFVPIAFSIAGPYWSAVFGNCMVAACGILHLVGLGLCCSVPVATSLRSKTISSLIAFGVAVVFTSVFVFMEVHLGIKAFGPRREVSIFSLVAWLTALTAGLAAFASHVFFLQFVKALARLLRREDIMRDAHSHIVLVFVLLGVLVAIATFAVLPSQPFLSFLIDVGTVTMVILILVLVLWYLFMLISARFLIRASSYENTRAPEQK
ncbi:MAG: hypothetical protein L0Y72_08110 [Gemmataceae bacterium]|nr:hypothetical protein [Gemmataceae bacterium]MCI0738992.1 hypothetical protein [Gemmataceae bacterium]